MSTSKASICITLAHFNASGVYIGPSLADWQGDICISTAVIVSAGSRVIQGNIKASRDICFDMPEGGERMIDEVTGWTTAGALTIQGDVDAGRNISDECDCCDGS
jgi:hypothetical protein